VKFTDFSSIINGNGWCTVEGLQAQVSWLGLSAGSHLVSNLHSSQ